MENRRTQTRYEVSLPGSLDIAGQRHDCELENLSLGGALLRHARLPMGTRCTLTFAVPTLEESITIGGIVRWATETSIGIQFDGLRAKEVYAIGKYFELQAA